MAHKFSNRERIHRRALEAEISKREREPEAGSEAGATRRPGGGAGRVKLVWRVYGPQHKEVATFAFKDRDQADAEAARLTEKLGKPHVVKSVRVPV